MALNITLDTHIHYNINDPIYSMEAHQEILDALTFLNPRKKIAEREMLWNAKNLSDTLGLWEWNGSSEIIIPRGFVIEIEKILKSYDIDFNYTDNRSKTEDKVFDNDIIPLRGYQLKAADILAFNGSGIYSAATGSGKTRVMLAIARACQQKTIVICEKTDIAQQWYQNAIDLGFDSICLARDGKIIYKDANLIIALRQTLLNNNVDKKWINEFGCVIVDECHHQASDSMYELVQKFPAYYRFGCSATPDKDPDTWPITRAVLGPVVHSTPIKEVGEHLVIPSVRVIKTDFEFDYRPTVREGKKILRNNYNALSKTLENDWERNHLIAKLVAEQGMTNHSVLVVSKRKKHLEDLRTFTKDYIKYFHGKGPWVDTYLLTGDNSNEYNKLKDKLENCNDGFILFSTLADEGTNIVCLDRLFLAYPGRKLRWFEQAIGRIMRTRHNKNDAIVYDFRDYKVPILNSQYRNRAQNIYHKNGYAIIDG